MASKQPSKPLLLAAAGVVLIALDFRPTSFDLLPDLVGWSLLAVATWCLLGSRWAALPAVGALASCVEVNLGYHYVQYDLLSGRKVVVEDGADLGYAELLEFDRVTGAPLALLAVASVVAGATIWFLCRALEDRARRRGAEDSVRLLRMARFGALGVWILPELIAMAVGAAGDGYAVIWQDPWSRARVLGMLAAMALAVVLVRDAREPWARGRVGQEVLERPRV